MINPRISCSQLQISTHLIAQRSITIRDHKVRLTLFLLRKVLRTLKRFFGLVKELTKHIYLLIEKQPNRDIYFFRFRKFSKSEKNGTFFQGSIPEDLRKSSSISDPTSDLDSLVFDNIVLCGQYHIYKYHNYGFSTQIYSWCSLDIG